MKEQDRTDHRLVAIEWPLLLRFLGRFVAGIGLVLVWLVLLAAVGTLLFYAIRWMLQLEGIEYVGGLLVLPVVLFAWWALFLLAEEFLADIGIRLGGVARYLILPVSVPLATLSFLLTLFVSAGESIANKMLLWFSFALGVAVIGVCVVGALG